jgi:hypothetical protein
MKKTVFLTGILGILFVFGLIFTACDLYPKDEPESSSSEDDDEDDEDEDEDDAKNSFIGTWDGDDLILTMKSSTWEIRKRGKHAHRKGTYEQSGVNGTLTVTHVWDDVEGDWITASAAEILPSERTTFMYISQGELQLTELGGIITFTKA